MNFQRILAWIGIIVLVLMYVITLVFAVSGAENWFNMLMASIIATIMIPVLLHWLIRMSKKKKGED